MNHLFKSIKKLSSSSSSSSSIINVCSYSRKSNNILRNRYWYRNPDGQFKEYNESITVLPDEFKEQDEYKHEKKLNEIYLKRYQKHLDAKKSMYSIKLPEQAVENNNDEIDYCESKDDMPKKMEKGDPYKKDQYQCIFCKHNIPIDYKNVQLLSQFVSPYTGIIYSQQVTGLCLPKYEELQNNIIKARRLGLMPFFYKETEFQKDPHLFNPNYNSLKEIPNNYDKRILNSDD